ncbi:cytochrome c oxidase subunit 3 [Lutibacter holmesii]|uniref:Cytochrome c oxidase subunit 3 n=1 Tax=Lutibacter holmesii TaxID=1137985 RepID=A0ABW3WLC0_9FLAO
MDATIATKSSAQTWAGGNNKPLGAGYGKMMMWFFILSDALTFSGFLGAYGLMRFKFIDSWPIADEVFTHFPFAHGAHAPMYYVALMTFILIFSSVTMVLAVDAGHQLKKAKVTFYMFLTIIGGIIFLGSQAWEWKNFINGSYGALQLNDGKIIQFVDASGHQVALESFAKSSHSERTQHTKSKGLWFVEEAALPAYTVNEVIAGFEANPEITIRTEKLNTETKTKTIVPREQAMAYLNEAKAVVVGANLKVNEYGNTLFADFFFFITGFHGFHVLSGVVINIIIFFNVVIGTYEKRKSYEMVEKVGLYWHFVDLVWVFVFTFFYLV